MEKQYHIPVLVDEVITWLNPVPGALYVDVTFGGGGHTEAILRAEPTCKVIACDWDEQALLLNQPRLEALFPGRVTFVWTNFSRLYHHLKQRGIGKVQGILADFGTSQYQIKEREGFSFANETPLDMRMSPAHHHTTAATIVNHSTPEELRHILWEYGEERYARQIVDAIVAARKIKPITTTVALAELIARVVPRGATRIHPATRTFQALRIVVNKELDNIKALLTQAPELLVPGGRLVCITFHSLEDRIVKQMMQDDQRFRVLTKRIVTATDDELRANPSSRSAKLRAAERS